MQSLADAILAKEVGLVRQWLRMSKEDINQVDEYGFTPLIETAIVNEPKLAEILLEAGADPNLQDMTGGTALHWAVENTNPDFCRLLLRYHADPNAYNFAGQPVLVMPFLRQQSALRQLLIGAGADPFFAEDYINTKLLGHLFELVGTASIMGPKHTFVEVDFEGFYLEVTVGLIADSLQHFQNHFAARELRRYSQLVQIMTACLLRGAELIKYQQYTLDRSQFQKRIDELIAQQPLLVPVGYEGHAITFLNVGDVLVKCDRREDSRLYDNVMFYQIGQSRAFTPDLVKHLLYEKQTDEFVNQTLPALLDLRPLTEIKVAAQISGNCTWANVEAVVPALFYLLLARTNQHADAQAYYKSIALHFFGRWREWSKDRALNFCIQSYERGDAIRKACKAEILAAIVFQTSHSLLATDKTRLEKILSLLIGSPYEYLLKNYLRVYYYESHTAEGKNFANLLKNYGYRV